MKKNEAVDLLGQEVMHEGQNIGIVTQIRPNVTNGQRYAFVQPHLVGMNERRVPLDELTLVQP